MLKSQKSRDLDLAYKLQQQENCFGLTENAVVPQNKDKENYKPRTLIDQTLELIDPTPNIHTLFVQFNQRFFWNVLLPVEVKWSPRMTSCAGICTFHPRNRQCVISLSAPLLKLRPRKDLVETLLHEMIHGYLFLTNNNRDRDGHGPEFCKHMDRINKAAGTKITIYHSFHDEVKLYQQHWWRCNGPCHKRAPYFGTVRRAMNRAPGPNDFWWKEHQQTCGGQFIKIKEPENFKVKTSKSKEKVKPLSKNNNSSRNMIDWLIKSTQSVPKPKLASTPNSTKSTINNQNSLNGFTKLGNTVNNVHGWGTGGPSISSNSQKHASPASSRVSIPVKFSSSGILGGSNGGRSNLLDKLYTGKTKSSQESNKIITLGETVINVEVKSPSVSNNQTVNKEEIKLVECPICSNFVTNNEINKHVDTCLIISNDKADKTKMTIKRYNDNSTKSEVKQNNFSPSQKRKSDASIFSNKQPKLTDMQNCSQKTNCPICNNSFDLVYINDHLDKCLLETDRQDNNSIIKLDDTDCNNESIISLNSTSSDSSPCSSITENSKDFYVATNIKKNVIITTAHNCLVCNELILPGTSLNDHLEDCIGNVFKDDSFLSFDCDNSETPEVVPQAHDYQNDKYPCPVCMQLIAESLMNQHLDVCLANT
ncbi:unnamed protein product [Xylocopa violacea]|uniref:Protein with SprT-like domain at the N terminus n=1 Tax=Xylocopa violacea TaxID=135666 RepID=A0ABP1P4X7_XYLVO